MGKLAECKVMVMSIRARNAAIRAYLSGTYEDITISSDGEVNGYEIGKPRRYNKDRNEGGRKFLGYTVEYLPLL